MPKDGRPSGGAVGIRRFQRRARQSADKQALQKRIIETARKQFAAGSIETVSIQQIADALGYSKGTVLKYFPTKILLLLAVKQQNLEEVADRLQQIREGNSTAEIRLRRVMEAYIDYWIDNPDHFRSLYSMAGTVEDRRFPDGVYFGQTEISLRSFRIFVGLIEEFLTERDAQGEPSLPRRLATALLSAAHGVISLPLGTPTMKWRGVGANGRLVINSIIDAWTIKLTAARDAESWPTVSMKTFL